jgi:diguanylate cyclase (GGDEF)-like protein
MFFLFTVIGGIGMFLLAKEQKEEQLYIAATRDSLTGVLNRATLFESAASSISMCARNGIGFALAIIDIDNLKAVNDSCGHAAGDDLIRNFAQTVRREIRGYDHFGRIGGDEFVVMFQGVDEELLRSILERCRQSLLEVDNCTISATVTIGAVCVEKPKGLALSLDTLMKDCDRALYEGKDAGRDRVVVTRLDGPGISAP